MDVRFTRARSFVLQSGRLLERLRWAHAFEGAAAEPVAALLRAHQNTDGGLGHALEPDLRCAASQPLFCEVGLEIAHEIGWRDEAWLQSICSFLASVADADGMVGPILPSALHDARAAHWSEPWPAGPNPTAGLCAGLYALAVSNPWLGRASASCIERLLNAPPGEAHTLRCAAKLAEHLPDRAQAGRLREAIALALPGAAFYKAEADAAGYGLTPLHCAPRPDSFLAPLFAPAQINAHLDALAAAQQSDGGWAPPWDPPEGAARAQWAGVLSFEAVRQLRAWGRLSSA